MVDLTPREIQTGEMVDTLYRTVAEPVKSSSLFYILYYADVVEEIPGVEFDLNRLVDDLYKGFLYYGVYTTTREAAHIRQRHDIGEMQIRNLMERQEDVVRAYVVQHSPPDLVDDVMDFIRDANRMGSAIASQPNRDQMKIILRRMQDFTLLGSNPERHMRVVESLLTDYPQKDTINKPGMDGWLPEFNGPAWGGIAEHIQRSDDTPKLAWVDQSWAIEHNTGNWLNKIQYTRDEKEALVESPNGYGYSSAEYVSNESVRTIVQRILNANRRGDMQTVLAAALDFNDEVEFRLTKLRPKLRNQRIDVMSVLLDDMGNDGLDKEWGIKTEDGRRIGTIYTRDGEGAITEVNINWPRVPDQQERELVDHVFDLLEVWFETQRERDFITLKQPEQYTARLRDPLTDRGWRLQDGPPFDLVRDLREPAESPEEGGEVL